MNISAFYLTKEKYTYYVRIYNQIGQIVYESKKIDTPIYNNYETGTTLTKITDENINNNLIRINLTLDVKRNETVNISVNLNYNERIISGVKEVILTTPAQTVSIDIDSETIKSTHYKGPYNISSVIIGNKVIEIEKATSYYDYEDFAKTSYIKNISSSYLDIDADNLIDYLIIDFTINSKEASTYGIYYDLYDEYGNFAASIAKTQSLGTGVGIISTNITGQDLYKTRINGPYLITTARLDKLHETVDTLYYPYLTEISSYSDFERPPLPDFNIKTSVYYDGLANLINVTVTNTGEVPAFNIFVDVFDNESYSDKQSHSVLNPAESYIFNFIANNTENNSIFIAIVDFDNLITESDETDNIKTTLNHICVDDDNDGYNATGGGCGLIDCNDNSPNIYPGVTELCNNIDDNCNNQIDENLTMTFGTDIGACELGTKTCINGDFAVTQPPIEPKEEICNNIDDNCDGVNDDIKEIKIKGKGDFIVDESLGTKGWPINEEWKFQFESEIKPKKDSYKVEGETNFETEEKKDKIKVNGKIEEQRFFFDRYGYGFDLLGNKAKIKANKFKEELPFMLRISNFNESWQLTHLLGSKDGSVVDYGIRDTNGITNDEIEVKYACKKDKNKKG